ncbi:MAG TPA: TonB-dependent receptor, partial [Thermoanaerobaculia bacterium]|nr:TonB-dependent receptor [Thermoanaerobaculia bacterium]
EGDERRGFGGVHVVRGGLSLTAEAITRRLERSGAQPLAPIGQTHAALEGRFGWDLAPALRSEVRAGYLHDRIDNGNQFTGSVAGGGLDLTWTGLARHTCLFSADVTRGTIDDARFNFPVPPGQPPHVLRLTDVSRDGFGLTLQDTFEISQKLAVTAGVRFDHLSDTGQRATPRFSAVYRMTDRHILKVQYAEGFRAPTFFELYATGVANAALSFEVNKTAELNYVYRNVGTAARATFFYSKLVDMIFVNNSPQGPQFGNFREGRADGFELEWEREVTRAVKASATLSWVDAKDNRNAGPPPSFAFVTQTPPVTVNWLGNIALLVRAAPHTLVGARWNWVGERNTGRDNRGTQLVDLTVTQNDFFLPGAQLRAGVKNLFDDDVRYFDQRPDGGGTYFRWPGRTFFVQLAFSR